LSREKLSGVMVAEKIIGVIIIIIGILMTYNTYGNIDAAGLGGGVFLATGIVLVILGVLLVTTKTK